MLIGLVNSGIMQFAQSIYVIFGANIGTTVTAWILSLGGISSDNMFVQLLKPKPKNKGNKKEDSKREVLLSYGK